MVEITLNQRVINVVEYDPSWNVLFEIEKSALANILGSNAVKIEHIGSTAVKGLNAKPVIDILVEVKSLVELDAYNNAIKQLGFTVKGENGISGRRYFQKGGNQRTHHVHAFKSGDINLIRHRAFKDYLIAHPTVAKEYGQIKNTAVLSCSNNINIYMAQKNEFIQKYERIAMKWFSSE